MIKIRISTKRNYKKETKILELKTITTEQKHSLGKINRLEQAKGKISELEDRTFEISESEEQKLKIE